MVWFSFYSIYGQRYSNSALNVVWFSFYSIYGQRYSNSALNVEWFSFYSIYGQRYSNSALNMEWFSSYSTKYDESSKEYQRVKIANCFSAALPTSCGVLGPLLVTLCTTPLSSVIQTHYLDHHLYADDTHIYLSLATTDTNCSVNQLRVCLHDIFNWMTDSTNFLLLVHKSSDVNFFFFIRHLC